jgi:hypothetical protein
MPRRNIKRKKETINKKPLFIFIDAAISAKRKIVHAIKKLEERGAKTPKEARIRLHINTMLMNMI